MTLPVSPLQRCLVVHQPCFEMVVQAFSRNNGGGPASWPVTVQFPRYPNRDFSYIYDDTAKIQLKSLVTTAGGGIEAGHAVVDSLDDLSSASDPWEDLSYQYDSDSASAAEQESSN